MIDQLAHLKPKVILAGKKWHVISRKHGSRRICAKAHTFNSAINQAINLFNSRIVGRALRYERLRKMRVKEAL